MAVTVVSLLLYGTQHPLLQYMGRMYLVTVDRHCKIKQSLIAHTTHTDLCVFVVKAVTVSVAIDCLFDSGKRRRHGLFGHTGGVRFIRPSKFTILYI